MSQFDSLIAECDLYIRSGKPHHVIKRLSGLNLSRVPRAWRLPLAKICRRAGLFPMGLRLLVKLDSDPTPPEQAEYAVLLLRYGAINEALKRLNNINTSDVPEAPLFRAYAHFAKWEYHAAASELERYLQSPLSPSALLLGQTNLAFSYVECRQYDKALTLLADTIRLAKEQNHLHLESYNLAVRAQAYIQQGDYSQARGEIKNARRGSTESLTHDQFFITKIEMIAEGLEHGKLHPFIELKQMAQKREIGRLYVMRTSTLSWSNSTWPSICICILVRRFRNSANTCGPCSRQLPTAMFTYLVRRRLPALI